MVSARLLLAGTGFLMALAGLSFFGFTGLATQIGTQGGDIGTLHADDGEDENVVTVLFGDPRFPTPRDQRNHVLIPNEVEVSVGETVDFKVAGFHQIAVYDAGVTPGDIDTTDTIMIGGPPPFVHDPQNRIALGANPRHVDSTKVNPDNAVSMLFTPLEPGRYLVICTVLPHFANDDMFGFVTVLGEDEDEEDDD